MSLHISYPQGPEFTDPSLIAPSAAYRREAAKVVRVIVVFILTYLLLVLAGVALAGLCVTLGLLLVTTIKFGWVSLLGGAAVASFGILVLIFFLKFIVARSRADQSELLEIKEKDQPALFAFVRQVAEDANAPFPKKIFLTPRVDAFVFYNSSFWSLFFPVRKNLALGTGLIYSLNTSQLKAVIAHEFGHFSQKTMRQGTYIYQCNRVIHNLVYENEGYDKLLEGFANIHQVFAWVAQGVVWLLRKVVMILHQLYRWMNKQNLALSREMEFHADAVAASVSGGNHLISAFNRLDTAMNAWQQLMAFYQQQYEKGKKAARLYPDFLTVLHRAEQELALSGQHTPQPRVVYKDQWASHPTHAEREARLLQLGLTAPELDIPAVELLTQPESLSRHFIEIIYADAPFKEAPAPVQDDDMVLFLNQVHGRYQLPAIYRGYYDQRMAGPFDLPDAGEGPVRLPDLQEITAFFEKHATTVYQNRAVWQDIRVLNMIAAGEIETETFDLDGVRRQASEASAFAEQLEKEVKAAEASLPALDKEAFTLFFAVAGPDQKKQLLQLYAEWFEEQAQVEGWVEQANATFTAMVPLLEARAERHELEKADTLIRQFEPRLREALTRFLPTHLAEDYLHPENKKHLEAFLAEKLFTYTNLEANEYETDQLQLLAFAIRQSVELHSEQGFMKKKSALEYQASLVQV